MPAVGRHAIHSHKQRIDSTFGRIDKLPEDTDVELLSDYAKYLCIIVAGFIEKSLIEIVLQHARNTGAPSLQRYVERNTAKFTNANSEKIFQLLGSFNQDWRIDMESYLIDQKKDAVNGVYGLRNQIAHGASVGLTYRQISEYYDAIKDVVEHAQNLCIPE